MFADDALQGLGLLARIGGGDRLARHRGDDPRQHFAVADQLEERRVRLPPVGHVDADLRSRRRDGGAATGQRLAHDDRDDLHYDGVGERSEEHTSELQSLMRISYAVFCLKKNKQIRYTIIYLLIVTLCLYELSPSMAYFLHTFTITTYQF